MPNTSNTPKSPIDPLGAPSVKPVKPPVLLCSTAEAINATIQRLGLTEARAAAYFGVPVFTLRKWRTGERAPGAAVARLVEVLGLVETLAPGIHSALVPAPSTSKRRGRPVSKGAETMSINPA
jgi:hypothetical protein